MTDDLKFINKPHRYRRRLPHWESPGETYFITFRLKDSLIADLTHVEIGPIIISALKHYDTQRYWLFDYTIMPDHVHFIMKPSVNDGKTEQLSQILQSLKGWLAHVINRQLDRKGILWQSESYDHIIRNQKDFEEKAAYIFDNPINSGLNKDPVKWPWWGKGSCGKE